MRHNAVRLFAVSIVIIIAAGAVISFNLHSVRRVSNDAERLVNQQIPELREIGALQAATHRHVLQIYLYYATAEREDWEPMAGIRADFSRHLATLERISPQPQFGAQFVTEVNRFDSAAQKFHTEMSRGRQRNWDTLRDHLASAQASSEKINAQLRQRSSAIRERVNVSAHDAMAKLLVLNRSQLGFSTGVLLVTLLLITMLYARLKDQAALYRLAYFDRLSGLPNRRRLEEDWEEDWSVPAATEGATPSCALLLVKLDRFALITDVFGHVVTDQLVGVVTQKLHAMMAAQNAGRTRLYHLAPATWLVVLEDISCRGQAATLATDLLAQMAWPLNVAERELIARCSIGIAYYPNDGHSADELIRCADTALRVARGAGGGRIVRYDPSMQERTEAWLSIENALRKALNKGELELYYQPKINIRNGRCAGAEALLRWHHDGEIVAPATFIPVAEESGLILPIGEWVLNEAVRQWRQWYDAGLAPPPIAVNISAKQFSTAVFVEHVASTLSTYRVPSAMVELEITEEAAAGNPKAVIATLVALQEIGVSIAIDDFGTGYSSLAYLQQYPLDVIKIDRVFISKMETSGHDLAIVRMIMTLARQLGCKVVAEGVETETQEHMLRQLGCELVQGYLYGRPIAAQDFATFLSSNANQKALPTEPIAAPRVA